MNDQTFILLNFFVICDLQVHDFVIHWHSNLESELNNIVDFVIISLLNGYRYLRFVAFYVSILLCGVNFVFALYKLYLEALTVLFYYTADANYKNFVTV